MNRRRTLIGIATLVFGASGFVASGAFTTSSQGSRGARWVQVAGTNQAVSLSPQQIEELEGSGGSEGDESGSEGTTDTDGDGTDGDDTTDGDGGTDTDGNDGTGDTDDGDTDDGDTDDGDTDDGDTDDGDTDDGDTDDGDTDDGSQTVTTRVQVVTAPDNPGNDINNGRSAQWNGTVIESDVVRGTSDGFFRGFTAETVNKNAVSTVGRLQGGYPNGEVAFLIANVGPEEAGSPTGPVSLTATLFGDGSVLKTDQLRFPYRVVGSDGATISRGENLFSTGGVTLADGHVIEVVIVVDTTDDDDLERIDNIRFTATGVGS